ncbi:hypothetical protein PHJA_002772100 [Phtheirospermum japonicum]|uniref:Late embryogenesis abundant protein LEA-2 subgroup domain-containing protein n=1 Tax=Phtheirospermum japonicum TaxID=374723 RepID=A0A830D2D1_9LAMI|nr:hypothetical protein PHJA_002772100 [Phtheirospermum japonicum]
MPAPKQKSRRRCKCICLSVVAVILGLGLLFLILGLTVFKVKRPTTTIDSVSIQDLDLSLDIARLRVLLNVTLDLGVAITNPNRVGFKYTDSTAYLRYKGNDVGEVYVPAGSIGACDTRSMNLTLALMADRLLSNSALYSDVISGTLPLQTYVRLAGKVRILFNFPVVTYTICDLDISLSNRTVANQNCLFKTKL